MQALLARQDDDVRRHRGAEAPRLLVWRRHRHRVEGEHLREGSGRPQDTPDQRQVEDRPEQRPACGMARRVLAEVVCIEGADVKIEDLDEDRRP